MVDRFGDQMMAPLTRWLLQGEQGKYTYVYIINLYELNIYIYIVSGVVSGLQQVTLLDAPLFEREPLNAFYEGKYIYLLLLACWLIIVTY
jgi:hypothetical protein